MPKIRGALEQYLSGYVQSLEWHAAALKSTLKSETAWFGSRLLPEPSGRLPMAGLNQTSPSILDQAQFQLPLVLTSRDFSLQESEHSGVIHLSHLVSALRRIALPWMLHD